MTFPAFTWTRFTAFAILLYAALVLLAVTDGWQRRAAGGAAQGSFGQASENDASDVRKTMRA